MEVPEVTWDEIGGLEDVKNRLKESVEWPLTKPELFATTRNRHVCARYWENATCKAIANEALLISSVLKVPK